MSVSNSKSWGLLPLMPDPVSPGAVARGNHAGETTPEPGVWIRPIETADLAQVIAIDAEASGIEKLDYWYELFHRYGSRGQRQRFFLVAVGNGAIQGFVIGEGGDWEFRLPPGGW